jgi:rod shape-determining protein MreC
MRKILIVAGFGLIFIVVVATPFFISKPGNIVDSVLKIFSLPSLINELTSLRKENSEIKGQLFALESSYQLPSDNRYLYAKVFSLYPFNVKSRIYINLGFQDGIKIGQTVMFSKTAVVGQISSVSNNSSEVITFYDSKYSLPVKIGKSGIDGLLEGGVVPEIGLIDKTKQIAVGDPIVSASKDIPYGLYIGTVKSVNEDSSGTFFQAEINLPYALSDLSEVYVIKDAK